MATASTRPGFKYQNIIVLTAALAVLFGVLSFGFAWLSPVDSVTFHEPQSVISSPSTPPFMDRFEQQTESDGSYAGNVIYFSSSINGNQQEDVSISYGQHVTYETFPDSYIIVVDPNTGNFGGNEIHTNILDIPEQVTFAISVSSLAYLLFFSIIPSILLLAYGLKAFNKQWGKFILAAAIGLPGLGALYNILNALLNPYYTTNWIHNIGILVCSSLMILMILRNRKIPLILWLIFVGISGFIFITDTLSLVIQIFSSYTKAQMIYWLIPASLIANGIAFFLQSLSAALVLHVYPISPSAVAESDTEVPSALTESNEEEEEEEDPSTPQEDEAFISLPFTEEELAAASNKDE